MIEFTKAYKTSDGKTFDNIGDAQAHELETLFPSLGDGGYNPAQIAILIQQKAPAIVDILTTNSKSLPRARKVNGGTKKRTPKPAKATQPVGT